MPSATVVGVLTHTVKGKSCTRAADVGMTQHVGIHVVCKNKTREGADMATRGEMDK